MPKRPVGFYKKKDKTGRMVTHPIFRGGRGQSFRSSPAPKVTFRRAPKTFYRTVEGYKVLLIDGAYVRANLDKDFRMGSHHLVNEFIPADQIWIDDRLASEEIESSITHEIAENRLMKEGMSYEEAHERAEGRSVTTRLELLKKPMYAEEELSEINRLLKIANDKGDPVRSAAAKAKIVSLYPEIAERLEIPIGEVTRITPTEEGVTVVRKPAERAMPLAKESLVEKAKRELAKRAEERKKKAKAEKEKEKIAEEVLKTPEAQAEIAKQVAIEEKKKEEAKKKEEEQLTAEEEAMRKEDEERERKRRKEFEAAEREAEKKEKEARQKKNQ